MARQTFILSLTQGSPRGPPVHLQRLVVGGKVLPAPYALEHLDEASKLLIDLPAIDRIPLHLLIRPKQV